METYKIGFIVEQALGHITHGKNLQVHIPKDPTIDATWAFPAYPVHGLASKIPLYKSNWTVRAGIRTRKQVKEMHRTKPREALFFHTQVTAVLAADWLKQIPSIVSLDATPLQYDALGAYYDHQAAPSWLEQAKWWLNRNCYQTARHLVTWTEWTKQSLVNDYQINPAQITVIPPGVTPKAWHRPTPRTLEESQRSPVKILFVGGNLERKGGHLLLEAFRTLRNEDPAIELHLVTRDRLATEPGLYIYNDMQPNSDPLKTLYHQSDIFCLPTYGDCLPMVLSEASAASLPIVSTQLAGIPEIVKEGESGFLIPTGDGQALTRTLRRLIENPTLRLQQGTRAVQIATQSFDAEQNTFRLLTLIKKIVDEERAA